MAQERPDTPEKQLLKIIENPKAPEVQAEAIKRKSKNLVSAGALKGRLSFFREMIQKSLAVRRQPLDVRTINRVLILSIVLMVVYVGGAMTLSAMNVNTMPDFAPPPAQERKAQSAEATTVLRELLYYTTKPQQRNIFDFGAAEEATPVEQPVQEVTKEREIDKEIKSLRLAGIAWSDSPDAMIENVGTGEMSFVKKGGAVGKLKVDVIYRNKVVLSCQGEQAELE